jgi:hypothetical protein
MGLSQLASEHPYNANHMIYNKTCQYWLDFENPLDR